MQVNKIFGVYFSGTGTTKKTVSKIADVLGDEMSLPVEKKSFTLPRERQSALTFAEGDVVVFGVPVYAGRIPNLILPFIKENVVGRGALAVPVVLFGNRDFDDALLELRNVMEENGFHTVAGAAFVGEHSFSATLGAGRPDADDVALMDTFARNVAKKIVSLTEPPAPITVRGHDAVQPYYVPRFADGTPINILKVKPKTDTAKCDKCGWCAAHCPMGSIDPADPSLVPGKCIKCCACVKGCHKGAKYYDDEGYLYHKTSLEEKFARRAPAELFV